MKTLRLFLLFSLISTGAFAQLFVNPVNVPDTLAGTTFDLVMGPSKTSFLAGDSTDTYGINQSYLGPTLIFNKGDLLQMNVTNLLNDTSTMHWHGMHVAPEDDGGPHTKILPDSTWSPDFEVLDEATTFWYHPHLHSKTAEQVYWGAAGMIIVRDPNEASLSLPRSYGIDDFPVIVQDKTFDAANQFMFANLSDTTMVNGTLSPYLEVPAQMIRLRLLNASTQRAYNFGFPPTIPVFLIGTDGGLLETPLSINRILMSPGERTEIVVDFSGQVAQNFLLMANNSEMADGISGAPLGPGGGPGNPLDGNNFPVMEFRVVPANANPVTVLSQNLNTFNVPSMQDVDRTRIKIMDADTSGFPFLINSTPFNHLYINDTVLLGDTEVWKIYNNTNIAHPFHIHDVQFFVTELNGGPPPPYLRGRKDVILSIPGDSLTFITVFEDHADSTIPYMYHCHNLFHEDAGMMGQFLVLDPTPVSVNESFVYKVAPFQIYPNPAGDQLTLKSSGTLEHLKLLEVFNVYGQRVLHRDVRSSGIEMTLNIESFASGSYIVRLQSDAGEVHTLRFVHL